MSPLLLLLRFFLLCLVLTPALFAQPVAFDTNDRVCFIGNSITYNGGFYHQVALFYATRYPDREINFYNCGIGGNVTADVIARMDSDILVLHPTVSVIKLGMNDVRRDLYAAERANEPGITAKRQEALNVYRRNYEAIIVLLLKNKSRVILQTPSIYDETAAFPGLVFPGRNGALRLCAAIVEGLGKKYKLPVIDYWRFMQAINLEVQKKDASATIIGPDRVHPGPVGHFMMGHRFLSSTAVMREVSTITISATGKGKWAAANAVVKELETGTEKVTFTCLEKSLPFPVASEVQLATTLVPFSKELNKEVLRVTGLRPGSYSLKINDTIVGTYTASDYEHGIDLSQNTATPQYRQALKVLGIFKEYWQLEAKLRWIRAIEYSKLKSLAVKELSSARRVFDDQLRALTDTSSAAYKDAVNTRKVYLERKPAEGDMLAKMKSLHREIYEVNHPEFHRYEVERSKP